MTYRELRTRDVAAPAEVLWRVVQDLGGRTGYHAFDRLWRARAGLDRLLGGPGMRGRPDRLGVGDPLDFWRVEEVSPPRALQLRAEMRMPGTATLRLEVEPVDAQRSRLVQHTTFVPAGLAGRAFWWAELPGHKLVFGRMVEGIARAAESGAVAPPSSGGPE